MTLELHDVTKVYRGGKRAVDGMTLTLQPGVLGLLGPNGAGKSSLMRIAATVTRPTSGRVLFRDTDVVAKPDALRRTLGYLPQEFGVYPNLSAPEFLAYLAAVKGLAAKPARARIDELLTMLNLTEAGKRPLGKYSGGMLRRVGIAQALLADPDVLIVDEPTAGLDPEERVRFRSLINELAATKIIVLSTHIVSDVESVSNDIAIVAEGRLRRRGAPEELLAGVAGQVWETVVDPAQVDEFRGRFQVSRMVRVPNGVRLRLLAESTPTPDASQVQPDLEDVYLSVLQAAPPSVAPAQAVMP